MEINPLLALKNKPSREFVKSSIVYSYQQYGINLHLATKFIDTLTTYVDNPTLAIKQVYANIVNPIDKKTLFWKTYNEYKSKTKPKITYSLINEYLQLPLIVDIGCGNNQLLQYLSNVLSNKIKGIGTDLIDYRTTNYSKNVKFIKQNSSILIPINNEIADTVLLISMIHHIFPEEICVFLKEVKRIMKKNGIAIIIEDTYSNTIPYYNESHLFESFMAIDPTKRNQVLQVIDWIGGVLIPGESLGMIHPFYLKSMEEWKTIFLQNHFQIIKSLFIGFPKGRFHLNPQGLFILKKSNS